MGRKRTGCVVNKGGVYYAQVTVDIEGTDGETELKSIPLEGVRTRDEARAKTNHLVQRIAKLGLKFPPRAAVTLANVYGDGTLTFEAYFEAWIDDRKGRVATWKKDKQRLEDYVLPHLRGRLMRDGGVTSNDLRHVVLKLDQRAQDATVKFSAATAGKVWEAMSVLFKDATRSKNPRLRVLSRNPLLEVEPPDAAPKKEKQWLHPREFALFISSDEVPRRWREASAVAAYLYLRPGELEALHAEDIDLASGMVNIHRSTDPETKEIREKTKTRRARTFAAEPAVLPLLRLLVARVGGQGPLFSRFDKAAKHLRRYLRVAGLRRAALYQATAQCCPMTFHDLRACGITWAAIRGDASSAIRDRAGHQDVKQTDGYIRRASAVGAVGIPFPPLTVLTTGPGPSVHTTRDRTRAADASVNSLAKTGTYEVEPRGIESQAAAPITAEPAGNEGHLCANCAGATAPRSIPRDIPGAFRRGPTVQQSASAWALAYALEGLLARSEPQANAGLPARLGRTLATSSPAATAGFPSDRKGVRDVG
jgi:integrase